MFEFRKAILLLAVLVLGAGMASAQFDPLNCTLNGGAPPLLRAEGLAEEVGQAFIRCTGGNPFQPAIINIRVFTPGYNVTSRLLSSGQLEAALLIDDPAPGTVNVGSNAFFADTVPGNPQAVEWKNINFTPPGTTGVTRTLRMVNIRVNASAAGLTVTPTPVNLLVSVTGSLTLPLSSPFLVVGYIQKSLEVTVTGATLIQCVEPEDEVGVTFKELIPNAWRTRGDTVAQNNLLQIYNTESMYWDTTPTNWPVGAGVATQATQLQIVFSGLPAGVSLGTPSWSNTGTTTFTTSVSGNTITLTVSSSADVGVSETLTVSVPIIYSTTLPAIGSGSVAGSYAPISTVITPSSTSLAVPRFTNTGAATAAFEILPCETRLLFPFVTSIEGWDTGIAISNTSRDPFGTDEQEGACTLYFYGVPSDSNQTTTVNIAAGQQLLMTLSGGNAAQGLSALPNFTGYVIARCNFQYAHGYAFISDVGANKFAQGYIALVISKHAISNSKRYSSLPMEALNQ